MGDKYTRRTEFNSNRFRWPLVAITTFWPRRIDSITVDRGTNIFSMVRTNSICDTVESRDLSPLFHRLKESLASVSRPMVTFEAYSSITAAFNSMDRIFDEKTEIQRQLMQSMQNAAFEYFLIFNSSKYRICIPSKNGFQFRKTGENILFTPKSESQRQ